MQDVIMLSSHDDSLFEGDAARVMDSVEEKRKELGIMCEVRTAEGEEIAELAHKQAIEDGCGGLHPALNPISDGEVTI